MCKLCIGIYDREPSKRIYRNQSEREITMYPIKTGLWTNKIVKTKLPIEYNRKYKLSQKQRAEIVKLADKGVAKTLIAKKFGVARTTVYLILDEQYRKRTYANTKHNFTREYMLRKKYESQIYKKQILDKINKRNNNGIGLEI